MEIQSSQFSNPQIRVRKSRQNLSVPPDIIEEILLRIPVKSLVRFKCVSKPWRSLICSKRFIKQHLEKNSERNRRVLLASNNATLSQCSLRSLFDTPRVRALEPNFLTDVRIKSISLVGCCNGLTCVVLNRRDFILWNPSTGISKKLPPMSIGRTGTVCYYGLGYDESRDDYKVFLFVKLFGRRSVRKLYSLKTNSWKKLNGWDASLRCCGQGKLASGKLHWEGTYSHEEEASYGSNDDSSGGSENDSYGSNDDSSDGSENDSYGSDGDSSSGSESDSSGGSNDDSSSGSENDSYGSDDDSSDSSENDSYGGSNDDSSGGSENNSYGSDDDSFGRENDRYGRDGGDDDRYGSENDSDDNRNGSDEEGEGSSSSGESSESGVESITGPGFKWDIVAFDMSREENEKVEQPCYSNGRFRPTLGKVGECVAVLCKYKYWIDIWVMKESWKKVMTIDDEKIHCEPRRCPSVTPFCISHRFLTSLRDSKILVIQKGRFFIWDEDEDEDEDEGFQLVGFHDFYRRSYEADIYVESLVSL